MDVIVWAESEERERWWREVMGVAPAVPTEADELTARELSATSRMRVAAVRSIPGAAAA
ncbi:hypothetical protein [Rhodococcus erythropolis]|uniref:hypothetical protein n=1 Tax=Rhodococcus erythropolis TaxID=1833 RepID=UPI001EE0C045|nr:hypothetical protein [Rhodococcus erythropolis]UKO89772.1 hypothetical protein ITJ47_32320 [Rhodococcus erythropolis]